MCDQSRTRPRRHQASLACRLHFISMCVHHIVLYDRRASVSVYISSVTFDFCFLCSQMDNKLSKVCPQCIAQQFTLDEQFVDAAMPSHLNDVCKVLSGSDCVASNENR